MKTCKKCGEAKPVAEFYKDARKRDGLWSSCMACVKLAQLTVRSANREKFNAANAAYRAANPEKAKAASAKWYAANREKTKATHAAYYVANSTKLKAYTAAYYISNAESVKSRSSARHAAKRDEMNAASAAWRAANIGAGRIYAHNRRARVREAGGNLSIGIAERLFKLQRGKCACGCKHTLGDDYHIDHIMPIALGGTNTDDNIQILRSTCNQQKHAKHPIDFMQTRGFLL